MSRTFTIIDAIDDDVLFARWFKRRETWQSWLAFLSALFALPLSPEQLELYRRCTGRTDPPTEPHTEAWLVCGRRAGKSFVLSLVAVYLALFKDYAEYLQPGERGTILVIAVDRRQARTIMRYIRALLTRVPLLAQEVEREDRDTFDLKNGVTIEIGTASFRSVRGYTLVAALLDELAFFPTDETAAEPDYEIINAIRPGMSTIPGSMLLCASSPYARRGALWDAHRRHHGKNGDPILVWHADTRMMNPTVPQRVIDEATERDPAAAAAEYGAIWRSDIEGFVNREALEACVSFGVRERPPLSALRYFAFVDPSGGVGDSMTLAISHKADNCTVIDCVREIRPPFAPSSAIEEFVPVLKSYRITSVTGDRFAAEWPREQFRKLGVQYEVCKTVKSDLYRDFLPAINSRRVDLLDNPRLFQQVVSLERRTARGGRDTIDHPPGQHDDLANAVAGAVQKYGAYDVSMKWVYGGVSNAAVSDQLAIARLYRSNQPDPSKPWRWL